MSKNITAIFIFSTALTLRISTPLNSSVTNPVKKNFNREMIVVLLTCLVSVLAVSGNLLIIYLYFQNKNLQTITNIPLISLALADLIIGLFPVNMSAMETVLGYWPSNNLLCEFTLLIDYSCCQASIYHIIIISIDRYHSIKRPLKYRGKKRKSRVKLYILSIWIISFLLWAPGITLKNMLGKISVVKQCYNDFLNLADMTFYKLKIYLLIVSVGLGYFVVIPVVVLIYGKIYFLIKHQFEVMPSISVNQILKDDKFKENINNVGSVTNFKSERNFLRRKQLLRHKKALKMIAAIILAFIVTWFPYNFQIVLLPFCPKCYNDFAFDISNVLSYSNSAVNLFLYAFMNQGFRSAINKLRKNVSRSVVL